MAIQSFESVVAEKEIHTVKRRKSVSLLGGYKDKRDNCARFREKIVNGARYFSGVHLFVVNRVQQK